MSAVTATGYNGAQLSPYFHGTPPIGKSGYFPTAGAMPRQNSQYSFPQTHFSSALTPQGDEGLEESVLCNRFWACKANRDIWCTEEAEEEEDHEDEAEAEAREDQGR